MDDELINIIRCTIDLNFDNRIQFESMMSPGMYERDCKTIHINPGRRKGKSTAIQQLARRNDLIIVHNEQHKETFMGDMYPLRTTVNSIADVVLGAKDLYGYIKPRHFDYVWIDEPNLCDDTYDINLIYEYTRANLYIRIGE